MHNEIRITGNERDFTCGLFRCNVCRIVKDAIILGGGGCK